MTRWRYEKRVWYLWPPKPIGIVELIGGSYLASTPQITYGQLLEKLSKENFAIHAWSYIPTLDHQREANKAWKGLKLCRERLERRVGILPKSLRLGHSLGCKLHLLAPDCGRNSKSLVAVSFNNYPIKDSIPMLKKIRPSIGFKAEFNPNPNETNRLINERYMQINNLIIKFDNDQLDQSHNLMESLQSRHKDNSRMLILKGDHLTPVSAGLRKNLFGQNFEDNGKTINQHKIIKEIVNL